MQIKLDLMLDWFVCFEALLYLVLILNRLNAPYQDLRGVFIGAVTLYALSRVMQTIMLAYYFAATHGRMHRAGQQAVYWPCAILCAFLCTLQLYTALIYLKIKRRSRTAVRAGDSHQRSSSFRIKVAAQEQRPCINLQHHKSAAF